MLRACKYFSKFIIVICINLTRKRGDSMFDKIKETLSPKRLTCTNCGRTIKEGEKFTANITMPSEKQMPVSRLDNAIARTANRVQCETCH